MNLLADESVDRQIVSRLRRDGHAVRYIAEMDPGISDDEVVASAVNQHSAELPGAFAVLTPRSFRIRRLR